MQTASPRKIIASIDEQINANRAELLARCTRKPGTWQTWGYAWARHPDLHQREQDLFRQRGEAQVERDRLDSKAAIRAERSAARQYRQKKCPTCRGSGFARAA